MALQEIKLNVASIKGDSCVDGPGLRVVVFCQGCPHNCNGCHNPQSHAFGAGTNYSLEQIFNKIQGFKLCKGVTLSGGEPFCQAQPLALLAKKLKSNGYEVACYTGFVFEELLKNENTHIMELLKNIDVLIDGRFVLSKKSLDLRFRGSENQRILDVNESIKQGKAVLIQQERWVGSSAQ